MEGWWAAMNKLDELLDVVKNGYQKEEKKNTVVLVFAVIGIIAAVAGVAYAIYRHFTPDYMDDFEDDFEDDFDDYFEDDEELNDNE